MASLWRIQTNTDGGDIAAFCLRRGVLALGWSLQDQHLEGHIHRDSIRQKRSTIRNFHDYTDLVRQEQIYADISNVCRLHDQVSEDDLVWMRYRGAYYLGKVTADSQWHYVSDAESLSLDAANQRSGVEWHLCGDESTIPGAVATALIRGHTLQRIRKPGVMAFSQILYNELSGTNHYTVMEKQDSTAAFYALLSPTDCEDLLCMWLYHAFGYICIPSTNKVSTELYECVLVDPRTGTHIYPQVKNGDVSLNADDYAHLAGEVWLLTTGGRVYNADAHRHIHVADPAVLYAFAKTEDATRILPAGVIRWGQYLSK